ncbi:MAG TPA: FAD-dependent oxidoreductase [Ferruginibacter sp.]|nr:FAD-dependent oxidoreductase [Ferruginibacter sp.]
MKDIRRFECTFKQIFKPVPGTSFNGLLNSNATDIIIIGGGLAGLVSAIHLSKAGLSVIIIEKNEYPKHKVCGEYVSNEVLPYLQQLGADPMTTGAKKINRFLLSTTRGKTIETKLPLGGFGVSRYTLDHFLFQHAVQNGCSVMQDTVSDVHFENDMFRVQTKDGNEFTARSVIGAFGKRSNLDVKLERTFIKDRSPFVAVKTHLAGDFPEDLVALHNFKGGYCGISKVENGNINACYITNYSSFQQYRNTEAFRQEVLCRNPHLKRIFENAVPVFEHPLTISQVSFSNKTTVEGHMLMCGDAAGMIHPLCGNGMAMAIHSAKIASELILDYFNKRTISRTELEQSYNQMWNAAFKTRVTTGRIVQPFFGKDGLTRLIMYGLTHIPGVLPAIIKHTHGKPLQLTTD